MPHNLLRAKNLLRLAKTTTMANNLFLRCFFKITLYAFIRNQVRRRRLTTVQPSSSSIAEGPEQPDTACSEQHSTAYRTITTINHSPSNLKHTNDIFPVYSNVVLWLAVCPRTFLIHGQTT